MTEMYIISGKSDANLIQFSDLISPWVRFMLFYLRSLGQRSTRGVEVADIAPGGLPSFGD